MLNFSGSTLLPESLQNPIDIPSVNDPTKLSHRVAVDKHSRISESSHSI